MDLAMATSDSSVMPEPGRDSRLWLNTTPAGSMDGNSYSIAVLPGGPNTPKRRTAECIAGSVRVEHTNQERRGKAPISFLGDARPAVNRKKPINLLAPAIRQNQQNVMICR